MLETDRTYNPAGEYTDEQGNTKYYPNETDNYKEHHVQLNYAHNITQRFSISNTLPFDQRGRVLRKLQRKECRGLCCPSFHGQHLCSFRFRSTLGNPEVHNNAKRRHSEILLGLNYAYYSGYHFGLMTYELEQLDFTNAQEYYRNLETKTISVHFWREYTRLPLRAGSGQFFKVFGDMQYRHINMMLGRTG